MVKRNPRRSPGEIHSTDIVFERVGKTVAGPILDFLDEDLNLTKTPPASVYMLRIAKLQSKEVYSVRM